MTESIKLIGLGLIYLSTMVLGYILHKQKGSYSSPLLIIHKLISLSYFILFIVYFCNTTGCHPEPQFVKFIIIPTIFSMFALNLTGILISAKNKPSKILYLFHFLSMILTPLLCIITIIII